jgi:dipeptidyl-peptidase-4
LLKSIIDVTNRRPTPVVLEWIDGTGASKIYFSLAPGESRQIETFRTHVWIGRDARRTCVGGFVSTATGESWEIAAEVAGDYERKVVRSFPVYVAPEFRGREPDLLGNCLRVIDANARQLETLVPPPAWQKIRDVPIWLEIDSDPPDRGTYHSDRKWLLAHGVTLAKERSIQFPSSLARMAERQPNVLMHELAHAYHDRVLSFSNPRLLAAYERARAGGRYNAVRHVSGRSTRAYALTDAGEFFAELSEAYFGTNDFFPFTREELKAFDPDSFRIISDAWERPEKVMSR